MSFSVAKATLQLQMSISYLVSLSVTKTSLPLRITPISHHAHLVLTEYIAYQQSCLLTIMPIDHHAY